MVQLETKKDLQKGKPGFTLMVYKSLIIQISQPQ